jgi:hypothetical protein
VVQGANEDHRATLLILGTPTISLSASSGPAGGSINVTGSNWNPLSATTVISATDGVGTPLSLPVSAVVGSTGSLTGTVVTPSGTAFIGAGDLDPFYPQPPSPLNPGSLAAALPFSINANSQDCGPDSPLTGCTLQQFLYLNISPGHFTWSQATPFIVLNATGHTCDETNKTTCTGLQLDGTTQAVTGSLNNITVIDARGQGAPWSISAVMDDLTTNGGGTNQTLPANTVTLTPSCAVVDGNTDGGTAAVITGAASLLDNSTAITVCSANAGAAGGTFTAGGGLSLTVPASIYAGLYQATITLTAV